MTAAQETLELPGLPARQSLGEAPGSARMALYATTGKRIERHCLVLYLASDRDWAAIQRERNGNRGRPLATAPMTTEAMKYRAGSWRATSLRYDGKAPADAAGFADDLRNLGYDEPTVSRFAEAAKPCWPNH
jgi:hypothetical protein